MIEKYSVNFLLFLVIFSVLVFPAQAALVRMDFAIGDQPVREVYIELLDADAPVTVANFLNYVQNAAGERRYDGTFIHRSVREFATGIDVIQGGGFRLESNEPVAVQTDEAIENEFNPANSNVRGTLAMAKLSGQPDSANSQWFFNVVDNSAALDDTDLPDTQDQGGFTVFARVRHGMAVVDDIAAIATESLGGGFTDVPTLDHPPGEPVVDENLVTLVRVVENPPARAFADPADLDFGFVLPGDSSLDMQVIVQNVGGADNLTLGVLAPTALPFIVTDDQCSNRALAQMETCPISLRFEPGETGPLQGSMSISSNDPQNPELVITLQGFGAFSTATLEVNPPALAFGTLALGEPSRQTVTVRNVGSGDLLPGAVTVSGANASDFELINNKCADITLALSETCDFSIRARGTELGNRSANVLVEAQPDQSQQIDLTAEIVPSEADMFLPLDDDGVFPLGDTQSGTTLTVDYHVINRGAGDLIFFDISLAGPDAGEFAIAHNCRRLTSLDTSCPVTISFTPTGFGEKSATLELTTNDPVAPFASVPIIATSSQDNDGVPDAVEALAANGGDGNRDGVPDIQQHNVASLPDINGAYVTLEVDAGTRLGGVSNDDSPSPATTPIAAGGSLRFPHGFFRFRIEDVPVGGSATVNLYLPEGGGADSYIKYSASRNIWYVFDYDPNSRTGAEFDGNHVTLHFVDGGSGDDDLLANGVIVDPGAPVTLDLDGGSSSGGGGGGGCSLIHAGKRSLVPVDFGVLLLGLLLLGWMGSKRRA